jgi:hypothetical protein
LDQVVAAKPEMDHTRYHTPDELRAQCLGHIRAAVALLAEKATVEELGAYRAFVLTVADHVAAAHKEGGASVSPPETDAIKEITTALGLG